MKKTIYLVEDNADICNLVEYLLVDLGFEVQSYGSVTAFHQRSEASPPDMVILDIMLPDGSGLDICSELKADVATQPIPVLLMSAHDNGKLLAKEVAADDFISKPFDIDDFTAIVQHRMAS